MDSFRELFGKLARWRSRPRDKDTYCPCPAFPYFQSISRQIESDSSIDTGEYIGVYVGFKFLLSWIETLLGKDATI
jgi:hypothetical protein